MQNFRGSTVNNSVDFSNFIKIGDVFGRIYNGEMMIPEAERNQYFLEVEYNRLDRHRPRNNENQTRRQNVLDSVRHLRDGRRLLIDAFRNRIFPLRDPAFYP